MLWFARTRFFRSCFAVFSLGSAIVVAGYGVLLLAEVFDGHGSPTGNFLLFGLGMVFVALSAVVLVVGLRILAPSRFGPKENSQGTH
jgi:hypothetical protein